VERETDTMLSRMQPLMRPVAASLLRRNLVMISTAAATGYRGRTPLAALLGGSAVLSITVASCQEGDITQDEESNQVKPLRINVRVALRLIRNKDRIWRLVIRSFAADDTCVLAEQEVTKSMLVAEVRTLNYVGLGFATRCTRLRSASCVSGRNLLPLESGPGVDYPI